MKKKGMIRVMIIEFLADSPMDKIESASSADVIDGKYSVVVQFIFAVTFVAID